MTKLLVVCGPTGVGKTSLGIELAHEFNGEIISADSRQVYKRMNIGTGKQTSSEVQIWGYDLVEPQEEFSVAHFQSFAREKIIDITTRGKLPILVGGTGLYIKAVIENFSDVAIPRDETLREKMEQLTAQDLYQKLLTLDEQRATQMNDSDKKNPRRLIRAIEIALQKEVQPVSEVSYDTLIIGLSSSEEILSNRLRTSITSRISEGFEEEVRELLESGVQVTTPALSATGYREMIDYINKNTSQEVFLEKWFLSERQYIKRQLTWFKKQRDVHWFDIQNPQLRYEVEELVKTWHNTL